jgi:hypothetical protein
VSVRMYVGRIDKIEAGRHGPVKGSELEARRSTREGQYTV